MIEFTESAKKKVQEFMTANPREGQVLRISIIGKTPTFYNYSFALDQDTNQKPDDSVVETDGIRALIDAPSAKKMTGSKIDWVETLDGSGFVVNNPNPPTSSLSDPRAKKIQELLDNEINPAIAMHGGVVELIDIEGDRAFIRMGGGCHGCGMKDVTLKQGIENRIMELVPDIHEVVDTTDHASGTNPYYQSGH